ncbi:mandelate racemase/muconate lactonizing enzyme family protein [Chloroflexota bacterium]
MKIKQIEVIHTRIPLKKPFVLSKVLGTLTHTQPIVVRVMTDEGIEGLGEADPFVPFTEESPEGVKTSLRHYLGPVLLGVDPTHPAAIYARMDAAMKLNDIAKGAIDMACYDILGKAKNLPVYQLLGGCLRQSIPLTWGLGGATPEDNVKEVQAVRKARGIDTYMIKVAGLSLEQDIARTRALREVFPDLHIMVDANQGWDRTTAVRFAQAVEDCNIEFLEQPVPYWDIEGLAFVGASTGIPVSIDETLCTIHDATRVIEARAADVFSVKASKNGGIAPAKKIIDLAKAHGITCWMNSMIEEGITQAALLHLGVSSENIFDYGQCYMSTLRLEDDITTFSQQIDGNLAKINDRPGLGIDMRENILKKYTIDKFTIQ